MKTSDGTCAEIELRLVDGRPVTDDPEVADHVRSCLRCFRAASELRQVPRLAALLRQADAGEQPDPGELFWARFPRTVADAWERRKSPAPVPVSSWKRMAGWFRLPIPAALSGAAVAAALVLAMVHRSPVPRPLRPVAAPAVAASTMAEASADEESPALLGEDDPLDSLELADTRLVAKVAGVELQGSDEGSEIGPSPAEELDLLETEDLRAVDRALHGRTRI
jgi:hypothetical protein